MKAWGDGIEAPEDLPGGKKCPLRDDVGKKNSWGFACEETICCRSQSISILRLREELPEGNVL